MSRCVDCLFSVKSSLSRSQQEEVEKLREELRLREKEMQKFGFEKGRGLETYSIKEIKDLAKTNNYSKSFLKALQESLNKHLEFYTKIHNLREFRLIKENQSMENIWKLQTWLARPPKKMTKKLSKSETLLRRFFKELKEAKSPEHFQKWYEEVLVKTYKRDYDVYRFVEFLARAYNEYTGSQALVPDFSNVRNSTEEVLSFITKKKLSNTGLAAFLVKRINQEYPNLISAEDAKES